MKIAIVTSLNKQLYEYYAFRFLQTYNWPFDCYIYHEGWIPEINPMRDNVFYRDINETNPSLKQFIERNQKRNQFSTVKGDTSKIIYGMDFIKDAIRFSYKVYAKTHLMMEGKYDYVFWIDADVYFKRTITEQEIIQKILPIDYTICYLDRPEPPRYPECGFVGYNLTNKHTQNFVEKLREYYESDLLFNEEQWHDSYVWNKVREKYLSGQPQYNLTGTRKDGHVWSVSKLAEYTTHLKGKIKKDAGKDDTDK
jgi:hypothetical protein